MWRACVAWERPPVQRTERHDSDGDMPRCLAGLRAAGIEEEDPPLPPLRVRRISTHPHEVRCLQVALVDSLEVQEACARRMRVHLARLVGDPTYDSLVTGQRGIELGLAPPLWWGDLSSVLHEHQYSLLRSSRSRDDLDVAMIACPCAGPAACSKSYCSTCGRAWPCFTRATPSGKFKPSRRYLPGANLEHECAGC